MNQKPHVLGIIALFVDLWHYLDKATVTFILGCIVSVMAIIYYWYSIQEKRRNRKNQNV